MLKRKNLVLGMLVILLVITGYLNFRYNQNSLNEKGKGPLANEMGDKPPLTIKDAAQGEENKGDKSEGDIKSDETGASGSLGFFLEYRFERENKRKQEIDWIREIVLDNPNTDLETKNEAQAQLLEITEIMEKELNIEGLLKAKGFKNSIAMFNQDYVSIIVEKAELAPEEVAQISDIVKRETGKSTEDIRIIPTNQ